MKLTHLSAALVAAGVLVGAPMIVHVESQKLTYPPTPKGDHIDDYFGTKVADPYRWMEDLDSKEVADWVAAQNKVTFAYLEQLPIRGYFNARITKL